MRVLIDVTYARRGPSGTGVYVERLVEALRTEGADVIEAAQRRPHRYLNLTAEVVWMARLARAARRARAEVLHHPLPAHAPGAPAAQVVTVHDLAFLRVPECFNTRFRTVATVHHRRVTRAADHVVVPTEATAADARSRFAVTAVTVAPHGPGQLIAPGNRGQNRHFLYVGDAEPRKNLDRLLAAYARYREQAGDDPLGLVLAGRNAPAAIAPGVRTDTAPDLVALHRNAAALVIPSLHEGFGIPALEAMHAGTPVIAARTAGLAEVCGDAARLVDPRDTGDIAQALLDVAATPPYREGLRRAGEARAQAYSWQRSARAHLAAYEAAVRSRRLP